VREGVGERGGGGVGWGERCGRAWGERGGGAGGGGGELRMGWDGADTSRAETCLSHMALFSPS
jgi:hypothetical protein